MNPPQFGVELAPIVGTIARRLGCDRGASINLASDAAIGDDRGAIKTRSRDDRATIARPSWFFAKERQPFDEDQVSRLMMIVI